MCLFLTHQYTEQLKPEILQGILGNVGTIICFRIGARDAEALEQEFAPTFTKEDLIALPRHSIYIKLLIDGTTAKPFSANTLGLRHTAYYCQEYITEYSRKKYNSGILQNTSLQEALEPFQQRINDAENIPIQESGGR